VQNILLRQENSFKYRARSSNLIIFLKLQSPRKKRTQFTMPPSQEGVVVRHARREGQPLVPLPLSSQQLTTLRCPHNPPTNPRTGRLRKRIQRSRSHTRIPPQDLSIRTLPHNLSRQHNPLKRRQRLLFPTRTCTPPLHAFKRTCRSRSLLLQL
jgi:hypothetical protein